MKNIIVCFKIIDDYDELTIPDWQRQDDAGYPVTDFVRRIINCFDEAALENALQLKEQYQESGETCEITAITVNPGYSEHLIKKMFAVGIDHIVCIQTDASLDFNPQTTAELLAEEIISRPFEFVLLGGQAPPGNTASVPALVADRLQIPVFYSVDEIAVKEGQIQIRQEYARSYVTRQLQMPAIYAMENTQTAYLRIPTLREKMKVKGMVPDEKAVHALGMSAESHAFSCAVQERSCEMLDDSKVTEFVKMAKGTVNGGRQQ